MSRNSTLRKLRTLPVTMACATALALSAPAAASPPAGPAAIWQWLTGLVGLASMEGEAGHIVDPNGARPLSFGEAGNIVDPDGASASADNEAGNIVDPNG